MLTQLLERQGISAVVQPFVDVASSRALKIERRPMHLWSVSRISALRATRPMCVFSSAA